MTAPTPTPDLNEVKDVETRVALIEIAAAWLGIAVPSVRDEFSIKIADAILSSGLVVPAAEVEETKRLLSDPNAVHINMLAGKIAKPSVEQIVHVYAGRIVPADRYNDIVEWDVDLDDEDLIERQALEIARLKARWNDATQMTREDIRRQALEEAAQVIDARARNEMNRAEQHKAAGKHYKAREAAHVARVAEQDAARIRALTNKDRNDGE